jgi:hypothetical protein
MGIKSSINPLRIVFLKTEQQCILYEKTHRRGQDLIIPLGPSAIFFAEKNEWLFENISNLFSKENYKSEAKKSKKIIDELLEKLNRYSDEYSSNFSLEIGNYYAFRLWLFIGQIHYNFFVLDSLAKKFGKVDILLFTKTLSKDENRKFTSNRSHWNVNVLDDELFHQLILKVKFLFKDVEIICNFEKNNTNSIRDYAVNNFSTNKMIFFRRIRDQYKLNTFRQGGRRILLVGAGYDWFNIAKKDKFFRKFKIEFLSQPRKLKKTVVNKEIEFMLHNSVLKDGICIYDLSNIAKMISTDLELFSSQFSVISKKIKKYEAVISSALSEPWDNFIAHLFKTNNLPVLIWQHGEKGQTIDVTSKHTETQYATDYLCYGDKVKNIYNQLAELGSSFNVHVVGSLGKNIEREEGDYILYATGKWIGISTPFLALYDPDKRLYDTQMEILNYLDKLPTKNRIIFKANNTRCANESKSFDNYTNINFIYSGSFSNLIKKAKVIILDTPATTLVEACSTNIPIFVVGGRSIYLDDFLSDIKERVVWCDNSEELVYKLNQYVKNSDYPADISSNKYISGYVGKNSETQVINSVIGVLEKAINRVSE